jgi:hypothetical protein
MLRSGPAAPAATPAAPLSELWSEPPPADLAARDLLHGPGGPERTPGREAPYTVQRRDTTGYSDGYDVTDAEGRAWDIKLGKEAQSEVVASRILWALGYHQPPVYYASGWQLTGEWDGEGEPARFRLEADHESDGEWEWRDNPFVGTQVLNGLLAVNLLLNNWDLKTSNNRIYRMRDRRAEPSRRFVVQDLGATLGKPRPFPHGTRNDIEHFEEGRLIRDAGEGRVLLDYSGRHRDTVEQLRVADVIWACALMDRLSDEQLDDAFEAAGYAPDVRRRFVAKIREKVREGLALRSLPGVASGARG